MPQLINELHNVTFTHPQEKRKKPPKRQKFQASQFTRQNHLARKPSIMTCSNCLMAVRKTVKEGHTTGQTHIVAALMSPVLLTWVPYVFHFAKDVIHRCPHCRVQLGVTVFKLLGQTKDKQEKLETANSILNAEGRKCSNHNQEQLEDNRTGNRISKLEIQTMTERKSAGVETPSEAISWRTATDEPVSFQRVPIIDENLGYNNRTRENYFHSTIPSVDTLSTVPVGHSSSPTNVTYKSSGPQNTTPSLEKVPSTPYLTPINSELVPNITVAPTQCTLPEFEQEFEIILHKDETPPAQLGAEDIVSFTSRPRETNNPLDNRLVKLQVLKVERNQHILLHPDTVGEDGMHSSTEKLAHDKKETDTTHDMFTCSPKRYKKCKKCRRPKKSKEEDEVT